MNLLLIAPLVLVAGGVVAGWFLPRLVAPALGARLLVAALVVAAAGITAALALVLLASVSEIPAISDAVGWCRALYPGDHGAAPWAGLLAGLLLAAAAIRAVRYGRRVQSERAPFGAVDGLEVVVTDEPIAFAVPGRPGGVVVGSELLRCLGPQERAAVLAHEQAHLRHHHHRYVHAAELCAAAFPFLTPLARDVRFATERWADESAAAEIGSRRTLAKAIARVALMGGGSNRRTAMAFTGRGATARVDALLHPGDPRRFELAMAVVIATLLATLGGASVQVHHLAVFLMHVCRL